MKRRSFFAALTAPLALLWPGRKAPKQTKPSPAEVLGAAHEAGIKFSFHFGERSDGDRTVIMARSPRYDTCSSWEISHPPPFHGYSLPGRPYDEVLDEIAKRLVSSMTPEEKQRYHRCLLKGDRYDA